MPFALILTLPCAADVLPAENVNGSPSASKPDKVPEKVVFNPTLILTGIATGGEFEASRRFTVTVASVLSTVSSFTLNENESLPVKPILGE